MSNSIRIRFVRGEEVKYISHLDLMKVFDRALRRSCLPVAYSQGFNPHPRMVFGLPLSVGVTSETEYADFELTLKMSPCEFMHILNAQLPAGLEITDAMENESDGNIMSSIASASYEVLVVSGNKTGIMSIREKVCELLDKPAIIVRKESKSGLKDIDIRPMIYRLVTKGIDELQTESASIFIRNHVNRILNECVPFDITGTGDLILLSMLLSAGSSANLKPELLVSALEKTAEMELKPLKIHRTGLFIKKDGRMIDPFCDILYEVK